MEPPSHILAQQLQALGLATPADLRKCLGRVKKLARGLPVTDCVWIDALVRAGKLSQFQGKAFENEQSAELVIGRKYVLSRPVHLDPVLSCFEAAPIGKRSKVLVARMFCSPEEADAASLRILKAIKALGSGREQLCGAPFDAILERGYLSLLAPCLPGASLARLLVRRGRFPEAVVRSIAVEALKQLQWSENVVVHGDLRPANFWLTEKGEIQILNWGLLDAVSPQINIHSQLPLDAYDGLAPERLDAGKGITRASDVYGLGCLLWQLLTGRPPFPVADPLAKSNSHRQRAVPDVRTLAPEVSEHFAVLIKSMTAREVHRRPQSCNEVLHQLGARAAWNRSRLQRFLSQFESAAPRQISTERKPSRIPAIAGMALLTCGMTFAAWNRDLLGWPQLMRVSAATSQEVRVPERVEPPLPATARADAGLSAVEELLEAKMGPDKGAFESTVAVAPEEQPNSTWLELPPPDSQGIITLRAGQDYRAGELISGELLHIRGDRDQLPTLHVESEPLVLEADNVRLEHVNIVVDRPAAGRGDQAAVVLRSQTLAVLHSAIDWEDAQPGDLIFRWGAPTGIESVPVRLLVHDTLLSSPADLIHAEIPLAAGQFENVLKRGGGALVSVPQGAGAGLLAPLIFNSCTFRNSGPLVKFPAGTVLNQSGRISVQGKESVFELARGVPLLEFEGKAEPADWQSHVEIAAQGLIVEVGVNLAARRTDVNTNFVAVSSEEMQVDGLLAGDFHFEPDNSAGKESGRVVIDALPVRVSDRVPGVDESRLPQ